MARTVIVLWKKVDREHKEHYKTITLPKSARKVWDAVVSGAWSVLDIDVRELRAERKRKGGKRG